jgi:hypothetical protein
VCSPFNSIIEALKPDSESHISDLGYTIEVWPYDECDQSQGVTTFEECRDHARASFEQRISSWGFDPQTFMWEEEWPLQEIAISNLNIQGYRSNNESYRDIRVPYTLTFTEATAIANANTNDALCRVFWLTGSNVTIQDAKIDTTACCRTYANAQTTDASCTAIVCSGSDCNSLTIRNTEFKGVSVAVRLQCDAGCITEANDVSISINSLTGYNTTVVQPPIALFAYDVAGSINVTIPDCEARSDACPNWVVYKVATYDTAVLVTGGLLAVNISAKMSPERALYNPPIYPDVEDVTKHVTNYKYGAIALAVGLGSLIIITCLLAVISRRLRDDVIEKEE